MRRPWGEALRAICARTVPKRNSPLTQIVRGASGELKALSGQSTKLGKLARKLALLRNSLETESWALVVKASVRHTKTRVKKKTRARGAQRNKMRKKDTVRPSDFGQANDHRAGSSRS